MDTPLQKALWEAMDDAAFVLSPEGLVTKCNTAAKKLSGYSQRETAGKPLALLFSPDRPGDLVRILDAARCGIRRRFRTHLARKDGQSVHAALTTSPLKDASGTITGTLILARELPRQPKVAEDPRRLTALLRDSYDAITIQDSEGRILGWNRGAELMYGYSEAEALGMNHLKIVPRKERQKTSSLVEALWGGETAPPFETQRIAKDGRILDVWLTMTALRDEHSIPYAIVTTERDITERKRMEEKLQRANRELEAFVYSASHDLRTPLTAIIGFAEFLQDAYGSALDDTARKALSELEDQGKRMAAMLEDLLTLARMGVWEPPQDLVDVSEVIHQVLSEQQGEIAEARLEVGSGSLPGTRVPRTMLYQVFSNLIGNAVRYAGETDGIIEVGGERHGERVRFFVRDHGPGIPVEERQKIFDLFHRGSTGKGTRGTGLGLAIVRKIAQLAGGKAWVEETPGGGSTFWVEFMDFPRGAGNDR